jgi:hypothetical protein
VSTFLFILSALAFVAAWAANIDKTTPASILIGAMLTVASTVLLVGAAIVESVNKLREDLSESMPKPSPELPEGARRLPCPKCAIPLMILRDQDMVTCSCGYAARINHSATSR